MEFSLKNVVLILILTSISVEPCFGFWFSKRGRDKATKSSQSTRCKRNGGIMCQRPPNQLGGVGLSPRSKLPTKPGQNKWPWMGPQTGFTYVSSVAHSEFVEASKGTRAGQVREFSLSHPYNHLSTGSSGGGGGGSGAGSSDLQCNSIPSILHGNMNHCLGIKVGYRCRLLCVSGHEPSRKTIECKKVGGVATWDVRGAQCNADTTPTCRDNFNRKVDWFVAYRMPSSFNGRENSFLFLSNEMPDIQDFFSDAEYRSFTDTLNPSTQWIFDQGLLPEGTTAVARTLEPATGTRAPFHYMMYSDQPPSPHRRSQNFGHSKGVLAYDNRKRGFYLYHTQPNYPGARDHSLDKGQLFVCVTLSTQQNIDRVLEHVGNLRPNIYDSNIRPAPTPQPVATAGTGTGFHDVSTFSQGGNVFNLVSKSNINGDIYRHIADTFNQDIYVLTWRNGRGGKLGSECPPGKKKLEHVEELEFFENPRDRLSTFGNWPETVDHAKWLVGQTHGNDLFCATDLNRMGSQVGGNVQIKVKTGGLADAYWDEGRWGGGICLRNLRVANAFRELVQKVEPCPPRG